MITKNSITCLFTGIIFLLLAFCFVGCEEAKVIITKDYVINPNWDEADNSFTVTKMELKDNRDSIVLDNVSSQQLLRKLVEDSSFSFITNVKYNGEEYAKRKVYFDRKNGFSWGKLNDRHSSYEQEILGKLQQNTWYFLGGLGKEKTLYYVYIDSTDSLYTFRIPASAWTNY